MPVSDTTEPTMFRGAIERRSAFLIIGWPAVWLNVVAKIPIGVPKASASQRDT
jgi:hypothetical protein